MNRLHSSNHSIFAHSIPVIRPLLCLPDTTNLLADLLKSKAEHGKHASDYDARAVVLRDVHHGCALAGIGTGSRVGG